MGQLSRATPWNGFTGRLSKVFKEHHHRLKKRQDLTFKAARFQSSGSTLFRRCPVRGPGLHGLYDALRLVQQRNVPKAPRVTTSANQVCGSGMGVPSRRYN
jgi:hypothetical protein